ncbi:MAG: hypothetical protein M3R47_12955, partial [Chloroflexota bacterium]|nr:hypothetical protein [Chloroflexota bacterium]
MHRIFESQEARLSGVWITAMMALTSIHHIFRLGYGLLIPTLILTLLPYALLRWYAATGNTAVMKIYSLY